MRGGAAVRVGLFIPVMLVHYAAEKLLDLIAGREEPFDYSSATTAEIDEYIGYAGTD